MKLKIQIITAFILLSIAGFAHPLDSIRVELRNGKKYIVHRATASETMQSIAHRYKVEELSIMEANPMITEGVKKGMIVHIPLNINAYGDIAVKPNTPTYLASGNSTKTETTKRIAEDKSIAVKPIADSKVEQQKPAAEPAKVLSISGKILKDVTNNGVRKIFYKVGNGETLDIVATKFNTSKKSIEKTNSLNSISGGQIIKIEIVDENYIKQQVNINTPTESMPSTAIAPAKETSKHKEETKNNKNIKPKEETSKATNEITTNLKPGKILKEVSSNGIKKIFYKVGSNETLSSIAEAFNTTTQAIKKTNNITSVSAGQIIEMEFTEELANTEQPTSNKVLVKNNTPKKGKQKKQQYEEGVNDSTPYTYGDKIYLKNEDITALKKKAEKEAAILALNDMHANANAGGTSETYSHPVLKGETIESIAKQYNIATSDIANWNGLWDYRVREGMELIVNAKRARKPYYALNSINAEQVKTIKSSDKSSLVEDINQKGLCLLNDATSFVGILHKTAPVGTLIMVENADNFRKRFFTTTGVLKDTSNADVVLIIDENTAKELDINNPLTNVKLRFGIVQ